ncbi:hypothetical protein ZIOFF_048618 [Zingiber officinale]|uniref:Hflx-type G domain-containing protein n=1 Tax=Zingiber officinale TaxID=94328 RepID=A0A8J5KUE9_ZINOF|nr:hypothetical protein ZIOFF_048618 [Zingiber officinale]
MDSENKPGDGFLDLNFAAREQPETLTRAEEVEQAEAAIGKHNDGTDSGGGALAETEKVTVEAEDTEAEEDVVDEKSKDQSVRSSAKRKKGRRRKSVAVLDEHDSCCCPFQDENKTVFEVSDLVWGKRSRGLPGMSSCCSCIVPHRAATASASPSIASSPRRSLHHQSHYPFRRRVPFVRLSSTLWRCRTRPIGVLKEANEVDANVSEGDPSPEGGFREDATDGLVANGVAGEASEGSLDLVIRDAVRSRRKADEDEQEYDRYTMRNGREVGTQSLSFLLGCCMKLGYWNRFEVFQEKAYLVGVECKGSEANIFSIEESLKELAQLADTAGLWVVDSTYQKICGMLANPNPRTYIGSGKVAEIKSAIHALDVETVIFDDELSAGQLRNLEKALGGDVRVCDRTALILDIFNQRAATHEAALQACTQALTYTYLGYMEVSLAQMEYQLPRLTKMWSHLERQAGGKVKGMGEKQIEVDKRILRTQISALRKELESVRQHRKQYRNRRLSVPVPVVSLVGYTNAGKSTLLNRLTGADVLAEDQLFATLDPTTRRVQVAAFRATLEEISESSLIVHVVDISHPLANQQIDAVNKVLQELDVALIPKLIVWNKIDKTSGPDTLKSEAEKIGAVCISAINGDGLEQFCSAVQAKLKDSLVPVEALIPYEKGELLNSIHQVGLVERTEYKENGTLVIAHVPLPLARLLAPMRQLTAAQ